MINYKQLKNLEWDIASWIKTDRKVEERFQVLSCGGDGISISAIWNAYIALATNRPVLAAVTSPAAIKHYKFGMSWGRSVDDRGEETDALAGYLTKFCDERLWLSWQETSKPELDNPNEILIPVYITNGVLENEWYFLGKDDWENEFVASKITQAK